MTKYALLKFANISSANINGIISRIEDFTHFKHMNVYVSQFQINSLNNIEEVKKLATFVTSIELDCGSLEDVKKNYPDIIETFKESLNIFLKNFTSQKSHEEVLDALQIMYDQSLAIKETFNVDSLVSTAEFFATLNTPNGKHGLDQDYLFALLTESEANDIIYSVRIRKELWTEIAAIILHQLNLVKVEFYRIDKLEGVNDIPNTELVQILDIFRQMNYIDNEGSMDKFEMIIVALLGKDKIAYQKVRSAHKTRRTFKNLRRIVEQIK